MRASVRRTLLLTATALAIWSFGYGPLLPWSPVHPGFASIDGERVTVLYPKSLPLPGALRQPDLLLAEAERFHRLQAGGTVTIVQLPDWSAAYRILPRLARRGIGAVTLATGRTIYLLPTIWDRQLDPMEFVRHELSHAVIHQNQSLVNARRIVDVQWLAEGVAVWFGRQRAYISEEDFLRLAPSKDLAAYIDPLQRARIGEPFDMRFAYVCWSRFNQFLASQDETRYWGFVHAAVQDPREWRARFQQHQGRTFEQAISAFAQQTAKESASLPPKLALLTTERHRLRTRSLLLPPR